MSDADEIKSCSDEQMAQELIDATTRLREQITKAEEMGLKVSLEVFNGVECRVYVDISRHYGDDE